MVRKELVGKKLDDFMVRELTEVYMTNEDGRKTKSLGFFYNEDIAEAFAGNQTDANYHQTGKALVLTNGEFAFLIGDSVTLLDDESAVLDIKKSALAKLTPAERKVLGI